MSRGRCDRRGFGLGPRDRPHWEFELYTQQADGSLDQRFSGYHLPLELSNGGFAGNWCEHLRRGHRRAVYAERPQARNRVDRPPRVHGVFRTLQRQSAAPVTPAVRYSFGTFYDGYKRSYSIRPSMRPNERLNASLNLHINDIDLPGVSYVSTLATARVNYSFSTSTFLNALLQYSTDTKQLEFQRAVQHHSPSTERLVPRLQRAARRTEGHQIDRAIVAKFTYMLAL